MKMNYVKLKESKFEYRVLSSRKALSSNSGPPKFKRGVQIQRFINQVIKLKKQALDSEFEGRHQVSSYRETRLPTSRRLHIGNIF